MYLLNLCMIFCKNVIFYYISLRFHVWFWLCLFVCLLLLLFFFWIEQIQVEKKNVIKVLGYDKTYFKKTNYKIQFPRFRTREKNDQFPLKYNVFSFRKIFLPILFRETCNQLENYLCHCPLGFSFK